MLFKTEKTSQNLNPSQTDIMRCGYRNQQTTFRILQAGVSRQLSVDSRCLWRGEEQRGPLVWMAGWLTAASSLGQAACGAWETQRGWDGRSSQPGSPNGAVQQRSQRNRQRWALVSSCTSIQPIVSDCVWAQKCTGIPSRVHLALSPMIPGISFKPPPPPKMHVYLSALYLPWCCMQKNQYSSSYLMLLDKQYGRQTDE